MPGVSTIIKTLFTILARLYIFFIIKLYRFVLGAKMTSFWAQVAQNIYIGAIESAHMEDFLETEQIRAVFNLSNISNGLNQSSIKVYKYDMEDHEYDDDDPRMIAMRHTMQEAATAMHKLVSKGHNVLVHCLQGYNRSALLICYYLMRYRGMSYDDALELLIRANSKRGMGVLGNRTFRRFLQNY